jgi:hypothetical protein
MDIGVLASAATAVAASLTSTPITTDVNGRVVALVAGVVQEGPTIGMVECNLLGMSLKCCVQGPRWGPAPEGCIPRSFRRTRTVRTVVGGHRPVPEDDVLV